MGTPEIIESYEEETLNDIPRMNLLNKNIMKEQDTYNIVFDSNKNCDIAANVFNAESIALKDTFRDKIHSSAVKSKLSKDSLKEIDIYLQNVTENIMIILNNNISKNKENDNFEIEKVSPSLSLTKNVSLKGKDNCSVMEKLCLSSISGEMGNNSKQIEKVHLEITQETDIQYNKQSDIEEQEKKNYLIMCRSKIPKQLF